MNNFSYLGVVMTPRSFVQLTLLLLISGYCLLQYRKMGNAARLLSIVIFVSFISESLSKYLANVISTTFPPYHFLIPALILLHGLIYIEYVKDKQSRLKIIMPIAFLTVVSCSLFYEGLMDFPYFQFSVLGLFCVVLSLAQFRIILLSHSESSLYLRPLFWYSAANFIFYSILCLVFSIFYFLTPHWLAEYNWIYDLIFILNLILYITYFIAIYLDVRTKKNSLNE